MYWVCESNIRVCVEISIYVVEIMWYSEFIVLYGFYSINVDFSICFDIIFIDLIYVLLNVDDFMGFLGNVLILRNLLDLVR